MGFTNIAQRYLRLHHLQSRFLTNSPGPPFRSPSRFARRTAILSLETFPLGWHVCEMEIQEKITSEMLSINTFLMKKRLSWFGHVQLRDDDNVEKSVLNTRIDGSRPRGRPKLRWMERLKDDMKQNKTRPEWASDRERDDMTHNKTRPEWASDRERWHEAE